MDIEQLKLVLETVQAVSGQAQSAAIWWVVISQALPAVLWFIFGTLCVTCCWVLGRYFMRVASREDAFKEYAAMLHVLARRYCQEYPEYVSREDRLGLAIQALERYFATRHTPKP